LEAIGYVEQKENAQKVPSGFSLLYRRQVEKIKRRRFRADFITIIHNGRSKRSASLFAGTNQSLKEAMPLIFLRDHPRLAHPWNYSEKTVPHTKKPVTQRPRIVLEGKIPAV
jgi:hypothetical protein